MSLAEETGVLQVKAFSNGIMQCKSCNKVMPDGGALFEHIQKFCSTWYEENPSYWAEVFDSMAEEKGKSEKANKLLKRKNPHFEGKPSSMHKQKLPNEVNSKASSLKPKKKNTAVTPLCIMFKPKDSTYDKKLKKCFMSVNDYFYATMDGMKGFKQKRLSKKFSCYSCGKCLRNNIRFMSHTRHKVLNVWETKDKEENTNTCPHCYRRFETPFGRQCHVEMVHASCKICELHFDSEKIFLQHMKDCHSRNEMPYVCQLCEYRSSVYHDVIQHFKQSHDDTSSFQCCFCLQVREAANNFLTHSISHVKHCIRCPRCRLQFLSKEELHNHCETDHESHMFIPGSEKNKNLGNYEVYVHIDKEDDASFESPEPSPKKLRQEKIEHRENVQNPQKLETTFPPYLSPIVIPTRLKSIGGLLDTEYKGLYSCWECKNIIGNTPSEFKNHFGCVYECKCCTYMTSCKFACDNHVILKHAEPDLQINFESLSDCEFKGFTEDEIMSVDTDDDGLSTETPSIHEENSLVKKEHRQSSNDEDDDDQQEVVVEDQTIEVAQEDESPSSGTALADENNLEMDEDGTPLTQEHKTEFVKNKINQLQELEKIVLSDKLIDEVCQTKPEGKKKIRYRKLLAPGYYIPEKPKPDKPEKKKRHRKVLAPEGYFPDINDEKGWEEFFNKLDSEAAENSLPVSTPTLSSTTAPSSTSTLTAPLKSATKSATTYPAKFTFTKTGLKPSPEGLTVTECITIPTPPNLLPYSTTSKSNEATKTVKSSENSSTLSEKTTVSPSSAEVPQTSTVNTPEPFIMATESIATQATEKSPKPEEIKKDVDNEDGSITLTNVMDEDQSTINSPSTTCIAIPPNLIPNNKKTINKNTEKVPLTNPNPSMNAKFLLINNPKENQMILTPVNNQKAVFYALPKPPTNLQFAIVKSTSLVVQWSHPAFCTVTQYKIIFKGIKAPTAKMLPPNQTIVRLVDLRPATEYIVRVFTIYKNLQSPYIEGKCRTLPFGADAEIHNNVKTNVTFQKAGTTSSMGGQDKVSINAALPKHKSTKNIQESPKVPQATVVVDAINGPPKNALLKPLKTKVPSFTANENNSNKSLVKLSSSTALKALTSLRAVPVQPNNNTNVSKENTNAIKGGIIKSDTKSSAVDSISAAALIDELIEKNNILLSFDGNKNSDKDKANQVHQISSTEDIKSKNKNKNLVDDEKSVNKNTDKTENVKFNNDPMPTLQDVKNSMLLDDVQPFVTI